MIRRKSLQVAFILACFCSTSSTLSALAQIASDSIHEVEVTLKARGAQVSGVRVRLLRQTRMMPVAETFSGQDGEITFRNLLPGDYIVETGENDRFEATATRVSIVAPPAELGKPRSSVRTTVTIDLPGKKAAATSAPGVRMADVDTNVPEAALKHYRKGTEAARFGNGAHALKEFKAAIEAYPNYYAARLELGRALRGEKLFAEAEEVLKPLGEIAPKHAEPHIEYGLVLLALRRQQEAASELRKALALEEANWATHLYLGWALLADEPAEAERHFARALELDEKRAAQAHLSLARLNHAKGMREESIRHLEAYLKLAPDAPDADAVRKLVGQLKKEQH
jgi:tetratricopeptide (TPR) repeat protein